MAQKAFIIPVAVLSSICVCMFVFIWWWFPRAWASGDRSDRVEFEEAKRRRELAEETAVGSDGETDIELGTRQPTNTGMDVLLDDFDVFMMRLTRAKWED
ncbi:hypothetical protein VTL71DRAFT_11727 [Oculimacula yallundae]|uniref:Transmembrane protein n=1 Tax=Oculimacula yallundae TaxID=86028 RepID=A0ABR4CQZ0_9HELO